MLFGQTIGVETLVPGGILLLALVVFQVLVGKRVIHFKGKTHLRVHRWGAYLTVAVALGHGAMGLVLSNGWQLF